MKWRRVIMALVLHGMTERFVSAPSNTLQRPCNKAYILQISVRKAAIALGVLGHASNLSAIATSAG